jgi:hypothetical protein
MLDRFAHEETGNDFQEAMDALMVNTSDPFELGEGFALLALMEAFDDFKGSLTLGYHSL